MANHLRLFLMIALWVLSLVLTIVGSIYSVQTKSTGNCPDNCDANNFCTFDEIVFDATTHKREQTGPCTCYHFDGNFITISCTEFTTHATIQLWAAFMLFIGNVLFVCSSLGCINSLNQIEEVKYTTVIENEEIEALNGGHV